MAKTKRKRVAGEIGVAASVGGRAITLDPIRTFDLTVPMREVESTLPCGLRMEWASGEHKGEEFQLTSGAGVGSRWLTFSYKGRQYCADVEDIVTATFKATGEL